MSQKAVFAATNQTNGVELWVTDGTEAGTELLKDIFPGSSSVFGTDFPNNSYPTDFVRMANGSVLFVATPGLSSDGSYPQNLWLTDGTPDGTVQVKAFNKVNNIAVLSNGTIVFAADDGVHGLEPWTTDGTSLGTYMLKNIDPKVSGTFSYGSNPSGFADIGNGTALFSANVDGHGLGTYVTDGTIGGTFAIPGLTYLGEDSSSNSFRTAKLSNGQLLFAAQTGTGFDLHYDLWVTDGTINGTTRVAANVVPQDLTSLGNGTFLFRGVDAANGQELWITDGTALGTHLLKDINPAAPNPGDIYGIQDWSSQIGDITAIGNGKAVFSAEDNTRVGGSGDRNELWISDGTPTGTQLLADINLTPGNEGLNAGSNPAGFLYLGDGKTVFSAHNGQGYGVYLTDGTSSGTTLLKMVSVQQYGSFGIAGTTSPFTSLGDGRFLFAGTDGVNGTELWISDGTSGGTKLLKDIDPTHQPAGMGGGPNGSNPSNITLVDLPKSAGEYILEYIEKARINLTKVGGNKNPTDGQLADNAYQLVIEARKVDSFTSSHNLGLRDAEYWLRGYAGGAALYEHKNFFSGLDYDWFNEASNQASPIATPVYLALKWAVPKQWLAHDGLQGTPPGGWYANLFGWKTGIDARPLVESATLYAEAHPADQAPSTLPSAPLEALVSGVVNGTSLSLFTTTVKSAVLSYFDPAPAKSYSFGVEGNTITGILTPTSTTTSPVTVSIDGHDIIVTPGVQFDLTTLVPGGVNDLKISGDFTGAGAPSFGFTFSGDGETLVAEAQDASQIVAPVKLPPEHDFNADGKTDVLWRGAGGELAIWDMNNNQIAGADQVKLNGTTYNPGNYWQVAGTGDFNADGKTDVLWRGAGGELAIWDMNNNQIALADQVKLNGTTYNPGNYWQVAGTGDFNADGKTDVLWRGAGGELAIWDMNNNQIAGADQVKLNGTTYNPGNYWQVAGTGDFNADGKTDVLWRGAGGELAIWDMNNTQIAGADQVKLNGSTYNPGNYWQVAGTGDFNADGKTDVLWRGAGGELAIWDMNNNQIAGADQVKLNGTTYNPGNYWQVAATGDYNNDGMSDVLWRGAGGELAIWDMNNTQIAGAEQATVNGSNYNPGNYWAVAKS